MRRALLSIFVGAVLELTAFQSLIPASPAKPATPLQVLIGYSLSPATRVAGLFGPLPDKLPGPSAMIVGILGFGLAFLVQAVIFALPVWLCLSLSQSRRSDKAK